MSELIKKSRWMSDEDEQEVKKEHKKRKQDKTKSEKPPERQNVVRSVRSEVVYPYLRECRHVDSYERLNHIEEGSYGIVFRAKDKETGDIVALKKLKLELANGGFPVTSLREIHALMNIKHPNIVNVREIVVGNHMDQ